MSGVSGIASMSMSGVGKNGADIIRVNADDLSDVLR